MTHVPAAINMPCETYEDFFVGPWATDKQHEKRHRELSKSIGDSLKGLGLGYLDMNLIFLDLDFICYMLLYGITLYTASQKDMENDNIPKKDREVIIKAQTYLDVLYRRYLKHLVGWKKGLDRRLNQQFLLSQEHECTFIFALQNLHLGDLTDNQTIDVTTDKMIQ